MNYRLLCVIRVRRWSWCEIIGYWMYVSNKVQLGKQFFLEQQSPCRVLIYFQSRNENEEQKGCPVLEEGILLSVLSPLPSLFAIRHSLLKKESYALPPPPLSHLLPPSPLNILLIVCPGFLFINDNFTHAISLILLMQRHREVKLAGHCIVSIRNHTNGWVLVKIALQFIACRLLVTI